MTVKSYLPGALLCCLAVAAPACKESRRAPAGIRVENGLGLNSFPLGLLAKGKLDAAALSSKTISGALDSSPGLAGLLEYVVECALAPGQVVDLRIAGKTVKLEGSFGMSPGWAKGPCDEACQEWVTACLMARTNVFTIPVSLYFVTNHPAAHNKGMTAAEAAIYGVEEGAFYGNWFLDPPRQYACWGSGRDPYYQTLRVCTQPGNACGFQVVGPCGVMDGRTGGAATRSACEGKDPKSGAYTRCHNRASLPGGKAYPTPNRIYTRIMTTYIKRSRFVERPAAAGCMSKPPGPDAGVPPDMSGASGRAGSPCRNDDDCNSATLHCDARASRGVCTKACQGGASIAEEEKQCGGAGTTCLVRGDPKTTGAAFCTRACTAGLKPGAPKGCAPGLLCTGFWLTNSTMDAPGCYPFCSSDSHCPSGFHCGRTGECDPLKVPDTLSADGDPCDASKVTVSQCRGFCSRVGQTDATQGICYSMINLAEGSRCPDNPAKMELVSKKGQDDMGLCMYRKCATDADCTAPLKCILSNFTFSRVCAYF